MRLNRKGSLALAVLALVMLASGSAEARTTAEQVKDRETLKAFVEGAKAEFEAITDVNEGAKLRERLRQEGPLKSGSMFLIIFLQSGEPFIHGNDRSAESKNLIDVEDDNGKKVVQELLAAGVRGGDFVEYHDGERKTAYAVEYTSGITGRRFVLVGGWSQDVSHVPVRPPTQLPTPAVTASQVKDRETLITFVEEAARVYREAVQTQGYSALVGIRNAFRQEGGDWKSGSIYLWVVSGEGIILFHATEPFREGRPTDMTRTDINGVRFAEELIGGARREGRKFLEYYYDDPTIMGDEDTGSPKLGYAVSFSVPNSQQKAVIGSGIYIPNTGATLDFAHFANGGGITSDVVLLNAGDTLVHPAVYFFDTQGAPIDAESVVEVTDELEVTEDGGLMVATAIEPLGERTISTHGRGELVSGSVQVVAEGAIGGVLRYSVPGVGVTGVGAGTPLRDALFPARRQQGGTRTAAAMRNLGEEAIEVMCRLMSGGAVLEEAMIPLEANGQMSWFIEEAFTATDTTDFVGAVRCTSPEGETFTGLAVEVDAANRIFTALPVVPVQRTAGERGATTLHFAYFANGGAADEQGIRSELVFVNPETRPSGHGLTPFHPTIPESRPVIYFYDREGQMIDPAAVVEVTDDLEVRQDGGLTIQTEMEPLGELTISTHGRGEELSGSVKVVSEGAIGGVLRYSVPGVGVTGVGAGTSLRDALFPARRQQGGIRTAAAMRNLAEESIDLTCRLMSGGGAVLEEAMIPLEANGQASWFIEEVFTATDTTDFTGSVRCTAPQEGMFTGLAVEVDAANRIFTTLPAVEVEERMPPQ